MDYYQNLAKELPPEENDELAVKAKDEKIYRDKLIIHNTRLVMYFANIYNNQTFLTVDDLFQEGILGLIKAVDNYDPKKGKFSTYASWYIRQYITRAIGDTERTIRVSIHTLQLIRKMEQIKKKIWKKQGREATLKEISKGLDITVLKVRELIEASRETSSLDIPVGSEGSDTTLIELIAAEGPTPEEIAESKVFIEQFIDEFKYKLEPIELDSIIMYYGLNEEGKCYTFKQIAKIHEVSTGRIGQVRDKALKKVRESLFIKELMEEVDEETNYYPNIDYTRVGSSGGLPSSQVERLAMKREALLEKKLKYLKED